MRGEATTKGRRESFLTIELLLSIGLAATAFASFLGYYHSVRRQQIELNHHAAATLALQSKLEEIRLGDYGRSLEAVRWITSQDDSAPAFGMIPQRLGHRFSWMITTTNRPEPGKLLSFKILVFWQEGDRTRQVSAATQLLLQ